jgi:hypothetical protein
VLESRVSESSDSDGGWYYRPVITYEYRVGRQVYTGDLLAFGLRSLSEGGVAGEKKAHETVARYLVGSNVEVHYHPQRPHPIRTGGPLSHPEIACHGRRDHFVFEYIGCCRNSHR